MSKEKINYRIEKFQNLESKEIQEFRVISKKENQSLRQFFNEFVGELNQAYQFVGIDDAEIFISVERKKDDN